MTKKIEVVTDGQILSMPVGSTIEDAIKSVDTPYSKGAVVCIMKKQEKKDEEMSKEFVIETTEGILVMELNDFDSPSSLFWLENYQNFENLQIRWQSNDAAAFGPFKTEIEPVRGMKKYNKYDIVLGAGGFQSENTHIIICRKDQYAEYGAPKEGSFAFLTGGRTNLQKINDDTKILSITRTAEEEEMGKGICTNDLSTELEDGDKLITYTEVELALDSPHGAEMFYALVRNGTFNVDFKTHTFCSDNTLIGEPCEYENFEPRKKGSVCIRSSGEGRSKVYIMCSDRPSSLVHSVIGNITKGVELPIFAEKKQKFTVETIPPQIMLQGRTLQESTPLLKELGIDFEVIGYEGEDNIIVKQDPLTTIEILGKGAVSVTTVPKSNLIEMEFYYDKAPKSVEFFRHAIELKTHPIGILPVSMVYDTTYIFKAEKEAERYKEILPENTPDDLVLAGEVGITNQSAKRMGYIGVRLNDEDLFGPTGERMSATNIIGKIRDPEKLLNIKEGDIVYIQEVFPEK
ncbi:MAG: methanogenesis marker 3 protein [Methanosarcinaceae archaeon]|nr:methanogenesis marker 3 protein [Methanosarcinaceae archaeon]